MNDFFSPNLAYTIQTFICQTLYQVYNITMARDHFSQMMNSKSHRHDAPHDSYEFDRVVNTITGMLYSIVTLKAFFPFFRSPAEIIDSTISNAPYPMPSKIAGEKEYEQLSLW